MPEHSANQDQDIEYEIIIEPYEPLLEPNGPHVESDETHQNDANPFEALDDVDDKREMLTMELSMRQLGLNQPHDSLALHNSTNPPSTM